MLLAGKPPSKVTWQKVVKYLQYFQNNQSTKIHHLLIINNALKVVTKLNLFVLICCTHNLHISEGDFSILVFQGQLSPLTNTKQL